MLNVSHHQIQENNALLELLLCDQSEVQEVPLYTANILFLIQLSQEKIKRSDMHYA